ncbi:MAG: hypothetical protein GY701_02620 [Sulfitobacter sp.]|nr:hypothetical protein [Sulfitobacter sp.]
MAKKKRPKKTRPERRRWTSTLASPLPEGPQGQPGASIGAEVSVVDAVVVPDVGAVSMAVPRPSTLFLSQATWHLKKADRLRAACSQQVRDVKWGQPGLTRRFTNEPLVYDFFEHAMAGIVLAHTALDNALNELLPEDFTYTDDKGQTRDREQIETGTGIELRLTRIAADATGVPNIRSAEPELFDRAMELKALRDDLGHAKLDRNYRGDASKGTVFSELFALDLQEIVDTVSEVADYYRGGETR